MAKWNRRQILSGLLAAVGAEATVLAGNAIAQASPLPATRTPVSEGHSSGKASSTPSRETSNGVSETRALPSIETTSDDLRRMLPAGLRFGRWRVVEVHAPNLGGIPVILEGRNGVRFQVDVLARDRRPGGKRGIAQTRHYALYLANLGRGTKPTREEHGLGVLWLAALMRTRERRQAEQLLTLRDRLVRFPNGRFDKLQASLHPTPAPAPAPTAQPLALPGPRGEDPTR